MKYGRNVTKAVALSLMLSQTMTSYPVHAENQEVGQALVQNQDQESADTDANVDTDTNIELDGEKTQITGENTSQQEDSTGDKEHNEQTEGSQEDTEQNETEDSNGKDETIKDDALNDAGKSDVDGTNTNKNDTVTDETQDSGKTETIEEQQDQKEETKQDDLLKNEKKTKSLLSEPGMPLEEAKNTWNIEERDECYIIKGNNQPSETLTIPTCINGKAVKIDSNFSINWGDYESRSIRVKGEGEYKIQFSNNEELKTFIKKLNIKKLSQWEPDISLSLDLTGIDVSNITDMSGLFSYGSRIDNTLSKLDISNWDTSKVTNMSHMFEKCYQLASIDFGDKFNTSQVTNMNSMFSSCNQFDDITSLSNWDVSHVEDMGALFQGTKLVNVNNLDSWNTKSVTNMARMFNDCRSLEDVSGLKEWDVSNVKDMEQMFLNCGKLSDINILLSHWNLTNVNNIVGFLGMIGYPYGTNNECIESIDFSNRWGENFKPRYIHSMIMGCTQLKKVNLSGWDTRKTGSMASADDRNDLSDILNNCKKMEYLDLSGWTLTPSIEAHDSFGRPALFKIESSNLRCIDFTLNDEISKNNVDRILLNTERSNPLLIISNQKSILEYEHPDSWWRKWNPCVMTFKTKDGSNQKTFETYALKDRTEKTLNATIDAMKEDAKKLLSSDEQKRWIGWKVENNDDVTKLRMSTLS